jgi:hypothetical protein
MRVCELRISHYKLVVFQPVRMHFCRRFAQTAEWPAVPSLQIVDSPYHVVYMESENSLKEHPGEVDQLEEIARDAADDLLNGQIGI